VGGEEALTCVEERARTANLLELFGALATACTADEVARAMVARAPAVFGAMGVVLTRLVEPGSHLEIMRVGDMSDDLREQWRTIPIDAPVPLADVARSRKAIFLSSRADWMERYPHLTPVVESTRHHANAVVPLYKRLSLRLLYRFEDAKIRDWHYDGVSVNPMPANNTVYLDGGPQDYHATVVGILLHIRM